LAVSFVASFGHVRTTVDGHGQHGAMAVLIALMPEISVALAMLKMRYGGMSRAGAAWTVLVGTAALAFTVWGNLEQAEPTLAGYIVAAWPAWTALGALGMVEMDSIRKHRDETGRTAETTTEIPASAPSETTGTSVEISVRPVSGQDGETSRDEKISMLRDALPAHPDRTTDQWAAHFGWARSTTGALLKEARKPHAVTERIAAR
jgi:hypothetical protein